MYLVGEEMANGQLKKYSVKEAREFHPNAIPLAQVDVNTDHYFFAHGVQPRGEGYWGFYVGTRPNWRTIPEVTCDLVWLHGPALTFSKAKREITIFAAERGHTYVSVAP